MAIIKSATTVRPSQRMKPAGLTRADTLARSRRLFLLIFATFADLTKEGGKPTLDEDPFILDKLNATK